MKGADLHPKTAVPKSLQTPQEGWGAHLEQVTSKGLWSDREKKATHKCAKVESNISGPEKIQGLVAKSNSVGC